MMLEQLERQLESSLQTLRDENKTLIELLQTRQSQLYTMLGRNDQAIQSEDTATNSRAMPSYGVDTSNAQSYRTGSLATSEIDEYPINITDMATLDSGYSRCNALGLPKTDFSGRGPGKSDSYYLSCKLGM